MKILEKLIKNSSWKILRKYHITRHKRADQNKKETELVKLKTLIEILQDRAIRLTTANLEKDQEQMTEIRISYNFKNHNQHS